MPYCPKCGVETDYNIASCPLCDFNIPAMDQTEKNHNIIGESPIKFPEPENFNPGYIVDFKRKTFYAITTLLLLNAIVFITFNISTFRLNTKVFIIILFVLSIWFYLMLLFGMISNKKIIIFGLVSNTFFFTFLIDLYYVGLGWFLPVFLPSTILGAIILIIIAIRIRLKKTKTFSIIFDISLAISCFVIGVEAIISKYLYKKIVLSLSIFLSGEIILLSLLLLFYYYKVPEKLKNKMKKKIHI
ncbi:MAG: hypothetical protein GY707_08680 [Desulfobacteraceae bacterium]|nr:hypothetical protein [Desulfobacteraceae bacterium]